MKLLITNIALDNYAGTECYVKDLSIALNDCGISVEVYSHKLGKIANNLIEYGIHVVNSLDDLKYIPDLIHGHHLTALDAIEKFKNVPALFFCHSGIFKEEEPIIHPQIKKYVAVDYFCADRIRSKGIQEDSIQIIHNWVDTKRFKQKSSVNSNAENILVFSNYATDENFFKSIKQFCENKNIPLSGIGWHLNNHINNPENILQNYDIVFAKAKCAMEAMACGCAVILCNDSGMGEMVMPDNFETYRKYNFGFKCMTNQITETNLENEIGKYNSVSVKTVSDMIREKNDFSIFFKQIIDLYRSILS